MPCAGVAKSFTPSRTIEWLLSAIGAFVVQNFVKEPLLAIIKAPFSRYCSRCSEKSKLAKLLVEALELATDTAMSVKQAPALEKALEGVSDVRIVDGQATLAFPNGCIYVGECKDGQPNGHGTLRTCSCTSKLSSASVCSLVIILLCVWVVLTGTMVFADGDTYTVLCRVPCPRLQRILDL